MSPELDTLHRDLLTHNYVASRQMEVAIFLALRMERPLFLEGEAGVGKTEVAKVLSQIGGGELIRLQCHEGLDTASALYEWDYSRQLLYLRSQEAGATDHGTLEAGLFSRRFLLARPLLRALESQDSEPPVLLIDEVDRADAEFEAFLLEILSDFQVSIPEIGTIQASRRPRVVLTSNRTREIHDALKRRCIYHWIDYPPYEEELEIVRRKVPGVEAELSALTTAFVQELRTLELYKAPGVAETLDWTSALLALDHTSLEEETINETLGVILKYQEDLEVTDPATIRTLLNRARLRAAATR